MSSAEGARVPRGTLRGLALLALLGLLAINGLAWRQARAMTRFGPPGQRTAPPEQLGALERAWVLLSGPTIPRPMARQDPSDLGLPYADRQLRSRDGTALSGWWIPAPEAVGAALLLHGYGGQRDHLLGMVPWLRARGWSTLLIDLRGHGASGGDQTSLGWHEAEDAAAAIAELRQLQRGPVVVYGFSMGAAAALRAASLSDRAHPDGIIAEASFGELSSAVEARFGAMGLPTHPLGELLLFWGGVQAGFWPWSLAPARHAASVDVPTLVIQGRLDARVSLDEAERICAALAQRCRPLWVEGMGHEPLHQHSPVQWEQAAGALLAEVLAGASGG